MLNCFVGMGRLTRDPELKETAGGKSVCAFSIAIERDFATGGRREADFIECVAWDKSAEFVSKYFRKGRMIYVCGRLQQRKWTAKDGSQRQTWEVQVRELGFGGDHADPGIDTQPRRNASDFGGMEDDDNDNKVPF